MKQTFQTLAIFAVIGAVIFLKLLFVSNGGILK
jgi:hypothetical protein